MSQNTFLTIFWILYCPLCVAFYDYVNDYVDEVMTLVLVLYTLTRMGKRSFNAMPKREAILCVSVLTGYLLYSLILQVNVPIAALIDYQQQIRPYAVLYCTWMLMPRFSNWQKKLLLFSYLGTLIAYVAMKGRAVGDVEDVVLGSLSMSAGIAYYLFTKPTTSNRIITIAIVLFGLLCGKFKYIGECSAFIAVLLLLKTKINFRSAKVFYQIAILIVIVLFFAWERFDTYFVSGYDNEQLARPMMYKTAPKVMLDYFPLGPGMATFGTFSSAKTYYSPLYYKYHLDQIWGMSPDDRGAFNADSFYPSIAQFGVVGLLLFILFWKKKIRQIYEIKNFQYYKVAISVVLCLAIESVADTSYLSGRGMIYFFMLGLCLSTAWNSNRHKGTTYMRI